MKDPMKNGLLIFLTTMLSIACFSDLVLSGEAQYAYDDLGRLTTVVDEAGNTAIYNYDAVGNLLGIDRFTPGVSGIAIYTVARATARSAIKSRFEDTASALRRRTTR